MTSSMLTGDRRWASARRGGMTVLGKVAVPKPINLPSQRLENHGLDPNVDIVPKGTHSWGTRTSPSTSNPWGSSNTPSPNNDGTGSPSYISGRPFSGGSGTRPSTAGSDRAQEPTSNAWGSNSRPSSASGTLTSSQSSLASLRPRSAETRPGSSHLSRFAEPSIDSSVAWGANQTAEKLGMTSTKNDGFSLTTGDFPTLGSEKETSGKSTVSQDHGSHGRPGSSSGRVALAKETTGNFVGSDDGNSNIRNDTSNSWRRENHMYCDDGARNSAEKWHQDHQPYPNSNIRHQQYDAWRGPPVNSHQGGVWYGGPPHPGGPPFGSPVGPGGFPMEPFPYYRPQILPGALNNPPPTGAGPRGPRPKNGDMYRPHIPDAYMHPGVPIRPGFYPGPLAYDGYYGPPMGYCSSNERDIPFMGMPMGPATYDPYSGQNVPDPSNSCGRARGPSSKGLVSDQMESGHPQDARGPYKVLLKQHDGWERRDGQKWDENVTVPYHGKGDHPKKSSWENDRRGHHREIEIDTRRMNNYEEGPLESCDNLGSDSTKVPEDAGHLKASDDCSVTDKEQLEPLLLVPSKISPVPGEPSLIQKIEGLNAKARASDGRQDVLSASGREEQKKNFQANDGKRNASVSEAAAVSESFGNPDLNISSNESGFSTGGRSVDSMVFGGTTTSRKSTHGMHGGADRRGKGRFNSQETDGWRKMPQVKEPPILVSPTEHNENFVVQGIDSTSAGAIEKPDPHSQLKNGEPSPLVSDPSDGQSQRARMTELVKQRFKQREKEEEEREREQRAKAQAKLEELNRRTQAGEVSSQKQETVPNNAVGKKREESSTHVQHTVVGTKSKGHNSLLGPNPSAVAQSSESSVKVAEISASLSGNVLQGATNNVHKEVHGNSVPVKPEASNSDFVHHENDPHAHDIGTSKQKRYRQKLQSSVGKNSSETSIASATEPSKGDAIVLVNAAVSPEGLIHNNVLNCESSLPVNQGVMSESSLHHKRKNRSSKSKHKVEEATSNASLPSKDAPASDIVVESKKATDAKSIIQDPGPAQATMDSKDASQPSDQGSILPNVEVHARATNQWKSQHPRKPLRNSNSSKSSEKFQNTDTVCWAPVRSHKNEVSDEANQRRADVISPSEKNEQQVPNNPRNKRAEMERYVPKPAVKEISQQGSSHQSITSSNNQTMSDETIGKSESSPPGTEYSQTSSPVTGKVGSTVEYRHVDTHGRQSKSGKGHGAWRQRSTTESSTVTADSNRNVQKPTDNLQHQKPDLSSVKEHSRHTGDWGISDGWNIPEKSDEPVNAPVSKEQGMMVKGKRYKATGYSHYSDEKRVNCGNSEKVSVQHSSVPEMKHSQLHATSKENRSVGERSGSHWQPKASALAVNNDQGSRSNDGQDVTAEVNTGNKKDSTFHGELSLPPQQYKESTVPKSQHHQDGDVEEAQAVAHKEPERGRKIGVHERRPVSPVDLSSSNMGTQLEQRGSSGFHKNGNQNSRFGGEHEHNGDSSGLAKDGKEHNASAQREKQRHSSHHEYQLVGPDSSITDNTVPTKDGSRNSYGRYKERGQAHPRRSGGNFNGRRTGNVRAEANNE